LAKQIQQPTTKVKMNILVKYNTTRQYTKTLCEPLEIEDYTPQSVAFASPPKWHLAHTTWFFEEMILKPYFKDYKVFDEEYGFLFNSYYNSLGKRINRGERGLITRPSVETIYKYRVYVDKHITLLLKYFPNDSDITNLLVLGINHEQQHQELLITDIKYTLSKNPINPKLYKEAFANNIVEEQKQEFIKIEEGIYTIGHDSNGFCYDNETCKHRVFLEPYTISNKLVTNEDYINFITSKGYDSPKYWLDDGWAWINNNNLKAPLYWYSIDNEWFVYTLAGLKKINLKAPVTHLSYYEANAYANFVDKRLPTEFEWEIAASKFNWGNTWEWTNSAYLPYPNYKQEPGAVGEYNGKFMINTMVLRGCSVATSPNHSRYTYRNFFSPETQWQFTGIRLAK